MNFGDRIRVEREAPVVPVEVVFESVPCRFNFLESVKNEQLMGAQTAQASIMIPHSFEIVEDNADIAEYRFYLLSPTEPSNLVHFIVPSTEKYTRLFRYFIGQVFQYGQVPVAP